MLSMPPLWLVALSGIVFLVTVWQLSRRLSEHDLPKGVTRGVLIFSLATAISAVVTAGANRAFNRPAGERPAPAHALDPEPPHAPAAPPVPSAEPAPVAAPAPAAGSTPLAADESASAPE